MAIIGKQFKRAVTLTFTEGAFPPQTVSGFDGLLSGLRISFRIERKVSSAADTATVKIYNLNAQSRAYMAQRSLAQLIALKQPKLNLKHMRISAGYASNQGDIFFGAVTRCVNNKDGPDWVTEIEASTAIGEAIYNTVRLSTSSPSSIPLSVFLDHILRSAGYRDIEVAPEAALHMSKKTVSSDYSDGSGWYLAQRLCKDNGMMIFQDLITVVVTLPGVPRKAAVVLLDERSGLLGTPKVTDMGSEFRTLLDPRIRPGQKVSISSQTFDQSLTVKNPALGRNFVVWGVTCIGDTHGDEWYSEADSWFYPSIADTATS